VQVRIPEGSQYENLVSLVKQFRQALSAPEPSYRQLALLLDRYDGVWRNASHLRNVESAKGLDITAWGTILEELRELHARAMFVRWRAR
jgi:hypothetical protein